MQDINPALVGILFIVFLVVSNIMLYGMTRNGQNHNPLGWMKNIQAGQDALSKPSKDMAELNERMRALREEQKK